MTRIRARILIESSTGLVNLGDNAILASNVQILKDLLKDPEIVVLSPVPKETSKIHNVLSKPNFMMLIGKWSRVWGRLKAFWLGLKLLWNAKRLKSRKHLILLNDNEVEFLKAFRECDAFFITGGGNLNDIGLGMGLIQRGIEIFLAKTFGKPIFLGAQTIGPLRRRWIKCFARVILEKADLITLRESYSNALLREIGIKNPRIKIVPDDAFEIKPIDPENSKKILLREGVDVMKLNEMGVIKVGLNARPLWRRKGNEKIKDKLLEVVDFLTKDERFYLVFVPIAYGEYSRGYDDVKGAKELIQLLEFSGDKVKVLESKYSWREVKALLGLFDIVITVSYHPAVFAMSMGTPTIGLYQDEYYRMKLHGLFKMMDMEEFVIDVTKTNDIEIIAKINQLLERRNEIKEKLTRKTDDIRKDACFAAKQLVHYLISKHFLTSH